MAEWLCRGLQILVHRFDSGPGLHARNLDKSGIPSQFGVLQPAEIDFRAVLAKPADFLAFPACRERALILLQPAAHLPKRKPREERG